MVAFSPKVERKSDGDCDGHRTFVQPLCGLLRSEARVGLLYLEGQLRLSSIFFLVSGGVHCHWHVDLNVNGIEQELLTEGLGKT
jgi:hypothetical protein